MAPEFAIFFAFMFLAAGLLLALLLAGGLGLWAHCSTRPNAHRRKLTRYALYAAGVIAFLAFVTGMRIRQLYWLNEPLVSACAQGDFARAQDLLDSGASPDALGVDGKDTALVAAIRSGNRNLVALLLEKRADPNQPDDNGKTPLQQATETGHDEIINLIKQAGASR